MARQIFIYGILLAVLAIALQLAEYRFTVQDHAVEIYGGIVALIFTVMGVLLGRKLIHPRKIVIEKQVSAAAGFQLNNEALAELNLSKRELEILGLMAEGLSNQEISDRIFVSVSTVKSHISNLYDKLGVRKRTQALLIAREHKLIP